MSRTVEEWRPVVGYEGFYEVSSLGRIKRIGGRPWGGKTVRLLKPALGAPGYLVTSLSRPKTKQRPTSVHAIVAEAFIGPRPLGHHVNHKDGRKLNNRAENLSYCTPSENMRHAINVLGRRVGYAALPSKLTKEIVQEIRALYDDGFSDRMIGRRLVLSRSTVRFARLGENYVRHRSASRLA